MSWLTENVFILLHFIFFQFMKYFRERKKSSNHLIFSGTNLKMLLISTKYMNVDIMLNKKPKMNPWNISLFIIKLKKVVCAWDVDCLFPKLYLRRYNFLNTFINKKKINIGNFYWFLISALVLVEFYKECVNQQNSPRIFYGPPNMAEQNRTTSSNIHPAAMWGYGM